eukprot:GHVU01143060.1.p1 GENE.GHVU01143060.1~~GHVU01143060.1.p1  ORF type:complete len:167 (-),score=8.61 GHVU01143060.1:748-1248(-)
MVVPFVDVKARDRRVTGFCREGPFIYGDHNPDLDISEAEVKAHIKLINAAYNGATSFLVTPFFMSLWQVALPICGTVLCLTAAFRYSSNEDWQYEYDTVFHVPLMIAGICCLGVFGIFAILHMVCNCGASCIIQKPFAATDKYCKSVVNSKVGGAVGLPGGMVQAE